MTIVFIALTLVLIIAGLTNRKHQFGGALFLLFAFAQAALLIHLYLNKDVEMLGLFKPDAISLVFGGVQTALAFIYYFFSTRFLKEYPPKSNAGRYYYPASILLFTAMLLALISSHIAATWIFVELTTLSASVLIYHNRDAVALEGTWKYLFVCSISIAVVFIGILFASVAIQGIPGVEMTYENFETYAKKLDPFWLKISFLFVFTGFTSKAGLFPMFTAGVDAKDSAPSPAGAILSSGVLNMGFVGIYRFYCIIVGTDSKEWADLILLASALISILVATVYMIRVKNIKRMLAYSSIEHAGIAMLGVIMGPVGQLFAVLHLVLHSFAKSFFFFHTKRLIKTFGTKSIYDYGGYFEINPQGSAVLLLGFFWLAALPPSGLFFTEIMIFKSLFDGGRIITLILVAAMLTVIIWAFARSIIKILFAKPVFNEHHNISFEQSKPVEWITEIVLFILLFIIGIMPPQFLMNLIKESVNVIQ